MNELIIAMDVENCIPGNYVYLINLGNDFPIDVKCISLTGKSYGIGSEIDIDSVDRNDIDIVASDNPDSEWFKKFPRAKRIYIHEVDAPRLDLHGHDGRFDVEIKSQISLNVPDIETIFIPPYQSRGGIMWESPLPYEERDIDIFFLSSVYCHVVKSWYEKPCLSPCPNPCPRILNHHRSRVVDIMRKEFGDRFVGGICNNNITNSDLYHPPVCFEDYKNMMQRAKIAISVSQYRDFSVHSMRETEALMAGCILVSSPLDVKWSSSPPDSVYFANSDEDFIGVTDTLMGYSLEVQEEIGMKNRRYIENEYKSQTENFMKAIFGDSWKGRYLENG